MGIVPGGGGGGSTANLNGASAGVLGWRPGGSEGRTVDMGPGPGGAVTGGAGKRRFMRFGSGVPRTERAWGIPGGTMGGPGEAEPGSPSSSSS